MPRKIGAVNFNHADVTGHTVHVCVSRAGRVLRPVPELLRLVET